MTTATLTKHSQRSNRRPCRLCGKGGQHDDSIALYWAHDSMATKTTGKFCKDHNSYSWVLIEADGTPHEPRCPGRKPGHATPDTPTPYDTPDITPDVPAAPVVPVANGHAVKPSDDRLGLLAQLLDMLAPKVDAEQVNEIIDSRLRSLDKLSIPFRVEVVKPDGTVKPVTGTSHKILPTLIKIVGNARKHVFMVGMAGTGKSTLGEQVAEALDLEFSSMSVGPTTSGTEIKGYMNSAGTYVTTEFRKRFETGGVMLLDEIDSGNPGIFTMINAALANGHMAFPDGMVRKHPDFRCLAAGNTYGRGPDRMYVGRQQMDAATLDRFMLVNVDVDETLETAMCYGTGLDTVKVDAVLRYTRGIRRNVMSQKLAVLVTPRASEGLCAMLAIGLPVDEAIEIAVRKGLSDSDWNAATRGIYAPVFD